MRIAMIAGLSAALAAVPVRALGGEDIAGPNPAGDDAVSAITEQFVTRHHPETATGKPRLSFDKAEIYRQDEPGKYAVLGGYMAFEAGAQPTPHAYGLTMRVTCPRHDDPECWRLEKLLIDKELVVDR